MDWYVYMIIAQIFSFIDCVCILFIFIFCKINLQEYTCEYVHLKEK